jgi:hypothetical protein
MKRCSIRLKRSKVQDENNGFPAAAGCPLCKTKSFICKSGISFCKPSLSVSGHFRPYMNGILTSESPVVAGFVNGSLFVPFPSHTYPYAQELFQDCLAQSVAE